MEMEVEWMALNSHHTDCFQDEQRPRGETAQDARHSLEWTAANHDSARRTTKGSSRCSRGEEFTTQEE